MKNLKLVFIILCLGLFLVPKEGMWSKASVDNCCNSTEMTDCCQGEEHTSHEKTKDGSHCEDDCCSTCVSCFHVVASANSKNTFEEPHFFISKKLEFSYSDPFFHNNLKEIWQPPKLI